MKIYKKFGIRKTRKFVEPTLKIYLCCKYKNKNGNKEKKFNYFMLLA